MNGRRSIRYAVAALGLGLALAGGQAAAVPFFSPITAFEDQDLDFHEDADGDGIIEVGDRLKGVLEIEEVSGIFAGQGPVELENDTGEELTGVFDITVVSKVPTATPGRFDFLFGPSGAAGVLGGGGVMVRLWTDGSPDLVLGNAPNCTSQTDCLNLAGSGLTDGSVFFMDLGFSGDADEIWAAQNAADSTTAVLGTSSGTTVGFFNNALTVLANNSGQDFAQQSCGMGCSGAGDGLIDWIGSGNILGGQGLSNGAFARSDFDGTLATAAVPEPGSVALLAVGLLGLGLTFRMRSARYKA